MTNLTAEQRLLLDCVRRQPAPFPATGMPADAGDQLDWNEVVRLAEAHGVWAQLLETFERLMPDADERTGAAVPGTPQPQQPDLPQPAAPGPALAAALVEHLRQRLIETTAQNLARTAQLARILGWLRADGVAAVAFKGPSLAVLAGGAVGGRASIDLDVLVSPAAAPRAGAVMLAHGYTRRDSGPDGLDGAFPPARREAVFRPAEDDLAPVELQTTVGAWPLAVDLDTDAVIARACTVDVAGVPIATLGPEDLLLTLAVHGTRDLWCRLRLIADIDDAVRREPNWSAVLERARAQRIAGMLWIALLLAHELLGSPVPDAVLDPARRDRRATLLVDELATRLFQPLDAPARDRWEAHVWPRSREHLRDRLRCRFRLLCWKHLVWRWDRYRRDDRRLR